MTFDPLTNLGGLLGMLLDIVTTTIAALLLPFVNLVVVPIQTVLQRFTAGV
jgi:hypothetical protein